MGYLFLTLFIFILLISVLFLIIAFKMPDEEFQHFYNNEKQEGIFERLYAEGKTREEVIEMSKVVKK